MLSPKDKFFSADHLKSGLRKRSVKNVRITLVAQALKLILQIGSIMILARLLEPSDFGLIAMVTIFTGLALQFMEGGLSMATIQRDHITHGQVSNLFWVNVLLGAALCVISILLSPIAAYIFDEPRITLVMMVMSITFLIGGLSVQHDAILKRQMRFRAISIIDIASMTLGIVAGIIAALAGLSYWALVISTVTTYLTKTLFRWASVGWLPSLMRRGTGVRPLLSFGANLTGANFIGYFASHITSFAVGYIGGAQAMGLYNRANTLTSIPSKQLLPPLMQVMQSALTRVQNDPERLRIAALSLMTKISIVTMLVTVSMFVTSDWLVLVLLGSGWTEVVDIFRILAIATIVTPITTFTAVIMVAVGQARALMRWKAITLVILSVSILIGSYWGVIGVLLAYCISGIFIRMPGFLIYSTKYQPITSIDYFKSLFPVFFCAMVTLVSVMWLRNFLSFDSSILSIVVFTLITSVLYVLLLSFSKLMRKELKDSIGLFLSFFKK